MKHYLKNGRVYAFEDAQPVEAGMVEMSAEELQAYLNPPPTEGQILAAFTAAIQQRLDDFARTRSYDGILSACSYVASGVQRFADEGAYCVAARDATWAYAYQILADVQAQERPMPTLEEVMAELPALEWPQ